MSLRVCVDVGDLAPGRTRAVEEGGIRLLVCNVAGRFHVIENQCPHAAVRLDAARLEGNVLECPVHGGKLDVRDGAPVGHPIRRRVATFPTKQRDGEIEIDLG